MKILEPIPGDSIPGKSGTHDGLSRYEPLYQQVLALNGKALPIEFENGGDARRFAGVLSNATGGRAIKLGIKFHQRDNILYLYKKS